MGRDCQLGQLCDHLLWRLMAWQMPLEKLLFLAYRGLKSQVPETGNWKQWHYISLNAEVLLFSCPVGWKFYYCLIPKTIAALLLARGFTSLHVLPTRGLPTVLPTQAALLPTKQVGSSVAYLGGWQL